jgi:DNA polymerase-3 subunit epsilon
VVDIETTGSWAAGDRITEIGAVKIRNHKVIDEWHSLVNPQRPIPAKITQITGITNEMVRFAPVFSEIADGFMGFMGDGIFVAHNVNFDYGFIGCEFERLERRFRFPKLCTVAGIVEDTAATNRTVSTSFANYTASNWRRIIVHCATRGPRDFC